MALHRTPGRSSFRMLMECLIATIECVQSTTERWKTHVYRCERLVEGSSSQIHFPSVTSEKNFEHSFGFIKKTKEEYIS